MEDSKKISIFKMAWLLKPNQQDLRNLAANSTILTIHIFGYRYVLSWVTFVFVVMDNKKTTIKVCKVFLLLNNTNNNNQSLRIVFPLFWPKTPDVDF